MKLKTTALTRAARTLGATLAVAATLGLAACGGSTSRVENFAPTRMVVFGDELSALGAGLASEPLGSKYGHNAVDTTTGALVCGSSPLWVQSVAASFGLTFAECGGTAGSANAVMKAAYGARVSQVAAQFAAFNATDVLNPTTLVTVMAGMHDVLDAYSAYDLGSLSRDQALAQASDAGTTLGNLVNRMANNGAGGRIVYATMPDLGLSPYAIAEKAAHTDIDRQQLLTDLSARFNERLRLTVINDGRYVGLVTADELLQFMAKNPGTYGFTDWTSAACVTTKVQFDGSADSDLAGIYSAPFNTIYPNESDERRVIGCSNLTLVSGAAASNSTYLWADGRRPGAAWQAQLGSAAISRARNNPF
jgi:phospholipase/lecithinase/hemolysin